jgi:hypothetical protein
MVLYFFNNDFQSGKIPSNLLDKNACFDYGKLQFLVTDGPRLDGNFSILGEILDQQQTVCNLVHSFAFREQVVKGYLLAWLGMPPLYCMLSEPELNHGYTDIVLRRNHFTMAYTSHAYLIEIRFECH